MASSSSLPAGESSLALERPGRSILRLATANRGLRSARSELGLQLGAAVLAVLALLVLLAALGYPVGKSFSAVWHGSLATHDGVVQTLMNSVPFVLAGISVWFASKVGLFNIGADGQLQVGGIAAFVAVTAAPDLPGIALIGFGLVVGAITGALWALIAGWLRVGRGVSEIISTIMLNFIAAAIGDRLISGALADSTATSPQTKNIPGSSQIGNAVHLPLPWAFVLAVLVAAALILVMQRTGLGLRLRAIGLNADAAERAGVRIDRLRMLSMGISGAAAGLAGALVVLGLRHYLAPGWAPAWGLQGVLIAYLALQAPALIPVWGLIFGMLATSAPVLKAEASVPDGIVTVIQVLPVLALFVLYQVAARVRSARVRNARTSHAAGREIGGQEGDGQEAGQRADGQKAGVPR